MATIGYHASHEQHPPSRLLACVRAAEQAGFTAGMCSDHFHPWSDRQGHSGFAWSWLGAALQATRLPFGVVNAPGQRYHPAVIAQAAATLAEMFPGRFWVAVGSGEQLNEHITGGRWPPKPERNQRLLECAEVMRALWRGETVTHRGSVEVEEARLYTLPTEPPRLLAAAVTPETARWAAGWADGVITVGKPPADVQAFVDAFHEGGGEGKPIVLQVKVSYAATDDDALRAAHEQWRTNVFTSRLLADLRMPADFEAASDLVRPEDLHGPVLVSSDPAQHVAWLEEYVDLGLGEIYVHNVHPDQQRFISDFGERVLPQLTG